MLRSAGRGAFSALYLVFVPLGFLLGYGARRAVEGIGGRLDARDARSAARLRPRASTLAERRRVDEEFDREAQFY